MIEAIARNDPGEPSPILGPGPLSAPARRKLEERLAAEAHRWVAVEPVTLATTPSFDGERFVPTPFALRAYVVANETGYHIMPGGMVRLAGGPDRRDLPNGFGKDLWIGAIEAERDAPSILRTSMREVHLRRTGRDLLSRTADNLFWLGRYGERAEGTMRPCAACCRGSWRTGAPTVTRRSAAAAAPAAADRGRGRGGAADDRLGRRGELVRVLMHDQRSYALRDSLEQLHRTATLVRDQISHDAWRMLNALHVDRRWRQAKGAGLAWPMLELLDEGIRALNAFSGTEAENMTRNSPGGSWRSAGGSSGAPAGRVHPRALVCASPEPENDGSLRLLLELGDSFMTYRSRYLMTPLTAPVLDLLLLDETNPRHRLPAGPARRPFRAVAERGPASQPRPAPDPQADRRTPGRGGGAVRARADGQLERLDTLLGTLIDGLPQLSDLISRSYFAHAEVPVATLLMGRRDEG